MVKWVNNYMKQNIKQINKYIFLSFLGGILYVLCELVWRSWSHWTMFILGAICFLYAGIQNEFISWNYPFWKQVLRTELFVLVSEFITGCIVNLWLGWNIWDYSSLKGNILGQTSWQFALLFLPLCTIAIILDDYLRYWFFNEEKPKYNFKLK